MDKLLAVLIIGSIAFFAIGTPFNKEYVKERAPDKWAAQGYEVIDYEGFQWGIGIGPYGGAKVWHRLKRVPDNGRTYSGYINRWGDELQVYGPHVNDEGAQLNVNIK